MEEEGRRGAGGVARLVTNSAKAQQELGWLPVLGLKEILESGWEWHRNRIVQPDAQGRSSIASHDEAEILERVLSQLKTNSVITSSFREEAISRLIKRTHLLLGRVDLDEAKELLRVVFSRKTWLVDGKKRVVSDQELMALLSKVLAISLRRNDAKEIADFLEILLNYYPKHILPEDLLPEAERLIRSYLTIFRIDKPIKIATVISRYGGQIRILRPEIHPHGENNLRVKMEQLEDLYSINPNIKWELILVQDGDDRRPNDPLKRQRTIDMDRDIILSEYPDYFFSGKVRIYELPQDKKLELQSVRTGATTYGAGQALTQGADFVIITYRDTSTHLSPESLLL